MANEEQGDSVTGRVKSIFFSSNDSLFKILLVKITATTVTWTEPEIVVKGSFGDIKEDESYVFSGRLVSHPKYGNQFAAETYQTDRPTDKDGLVNYLASSRFPGVGPKTAAKIVEKLGLGAVDAIMKNSDVLDDVGLKPERQALLVEGLRENLGLEQVIIGLNQYGLTGNLAGKIYTKYKTDSLDIIQANPYKLIQDIEGVGFGIADGIARQMDIALDSDTRLAGALQAAINEVVESEGDTYATAEAAFTMVRQLIGDHAGRIASDARMLEVVQQQVEEKQLVLDAGCLFPKRLFSAEKQIASYLSALVNAPGKTPTAERVAKTIKKVGKRLGIDYDPTQLDAIQEALTNKVFLLTGGPGTGKTTIINAVVHAFALLNDIELDPNKYRGEEVFPVMLAAPTGRAAKRIAETTNLPASTIHRLLGLGVDQTDYEVRELPDGLLVVDEVSMVDTWLMKILLNAAHPGVTIIFVGDKDQLPSVGPGQVFADMLTSHVLPSVELTHIHRQDDDSSIVPLAHAINEGELPADLLQKHVDRSFIQVEPYQVAEAVGKVVGAAKKRGFDVLQVQILAPMYRGVAGVDALNKVVQDIYNPQTSKKRKQVEANDTVYRIGDKVLQLVNNPENNVYNGEIGIINGIEIGERGKNDEITVDFDGNEISYPRSDWKNITLAYATSIHKAQGSEFDMVILPLTMQSRRMLKRNLVYTAITRAKKFLILVGETTAFATAASTMAANRNTGLRRRLADAFGTELPDLATDAAVRAPDPVTTQGPVVAANPALVANEVPETGNQVPGTVHDNEILAAEYSGEHVLTMALVEQEAVDPLIGIRGMTPWDE